MELPQSIIISVRYVLRCSKFWIFGIPRKHKLQNTYFINFSLMLNNNI
jgi:hypothetical protein